MGCFERTEFAGKERKSESPRNFLRSEAHARRAGWNIRGCGPLSIPVFFDRRKWPLATFLLIPPRPAFAGAGRKSPQSRPVSGFSRSDVPAGGAGIRFSHSGRGPAEQICVIWERTIRALPAAHVKRPARRKGDGRRLFCPNLRMEPSGAWPPLRPLAYRAAGCTCRFLRPARGEAQGPVPERGVCSLRWAAAGREPDARICSGTLRKAGGGKARRTEHGFCAAACPKGKNSIYCNRKRLSARRGTA